MINNCINCAYINNCSYNDCTLKSPKAILEKKLELENFISKTAFDFLNPNSDFDSNINQSLAGIGELGNADRVYIFLFRDDYKYMDNVYEWCAEGICSQKADLQNLACVDYKWWVGKLFNNEIIHIFDISTMSEEMLNEKETLQKQGIQSLLVVPVFSGFELKGYIGFDYVNRPYEWTHHEVELLKIFSSIYTSALDNKIIKDELNAKNKELLNTIEEIKKLQNTLIRNEKFSAIGKISAGIAHEINNPLGYVTSNFEVFKEYSYEMKDTISKYKQIYQPLRDSEQNNDEHKGITRYMDDNEKLDYIFNDMDELFSETKDGLDRIKDIVLSLKSIARTQTLDVFCSYDLNEGIKRTLNIIKGETKNNIIIDIKFGEIPLISALETHMNQVLLNIIVNAIYAAKEAVLPEKGYVWISTWNNNENVYCSVKNNGSYISLDYLPKIFDPFFTTKPLSEGTGLGLSIVYEIVVNKHNGDITVTSDVEKGTEFIIKLPVEHR